MTRIVINFTEPETRLLDKVSNATRLSYHDLIMKAVRAYEARKRKS